MLHIMTSVRLACFLFVLFIGSASAADSNGDYQVMGLGQSSCKAFISSDAEGKAFFYSWLAGYMTAYNRIEENTYSILARSKNLTYIEGWLQDYCYLNPSKDFFDATHKLLIKMSYSRIKRKPRK